MIEHNEKNMVGTTIIMVRKGDNVVIAGDGQVSLGQTIIKNNANNRENSRIGDQKVIKSIHFRI